MIQFSISGFVRYQVREYSLYPFGLRNPYLEAVKHDVEAMTSSISFLLSILKRKLQLPCLVDRGVTLVSLSLRISYLGRHSALDH